MLSETAPFAWPMIHIQSNTLLFSPLPVPSRHSSMKQIRLTESIESANSIERSVISVINCCSNFIQVSKKNSISWLILFLIHLNWYWLSSSPDLDNLMIVSVRIGSMRFLQIQSICRASNQEWDLVQ
jgi:hypothetical protein